MAKAGSVDIYKVLDGYAGKLFSMGLSAATISTYVGRLKQYLRFLDVDVSNEAFRVKMVLPRVDEPDDRAPTVEEIERMLAHADVRGEP